MSFIPLFAHQEQTAMFSLLSDRVLDLSDPGTGKTRATLEGYVRRMMLNRAERLLVVAPLSILEPSWGADIRTFYPNLRFALATQPARNRQAAFDSGADIVLINWDGVKWIDEHMGVLQDGFTDLCVDEFTAFKNRGSQRSRALRNVVLPFKHITLLSGTPNPNTLTDLWHPMMVLDGGARLGRNFHKFQNTVCFPTQVGPQPNMVRWRDKPGMDSVVAGALKDICVRNRFEDCVDIPPNSKHFMEVEMPPRVMKAYRAMQEENVILTEKGELVNAVNAAARAGKLLQILSGSVYDGDGNPVFIDNGRYELVMQLVDERPASVVGFTWQHEKNALLREAQKRKLEVGVIDGSVSAKQRNLVVQDFQAGKLRAVLCHPAAAAHGLTLTAGRATIWCSATYSSEFFTQLNRRIYRAGQDQKTETIMICAANSREAEVYDILEGKMEGMDGLLDLLTDLGDSNALQSI